MKYRKNYWNNCVHNSWRKVRYFMCEICSESIQDSGFSFCWIFSYEILSDLSMIPDSRKLFIFSNFISGHFSAYLLIFHFMPNCRSIAIASFKTLLRNIFCSAYREQNVYLFPFFNRVSKSLPELPAVCSKELTNNQINNYTWTRLQKTLTWQQV